MIATAPAPLVHRIVGAAPQERAAEQAIALLRPPYDRIEHQTGWSSLDARSSAGGLIAGIQVEQPPDGYADLDVTIRRLRHHAPTIPVVLLLRMPPEEGLFVAAHAARSGVRAVVWSGQPLAEALRKSLTDESSLAEDVVEWLGLYGLRLSPLVSSLLLQIVANAHRHDSLTALLSSAGVPETSARFRMHKKRLPAPSRWFQVARALHAALRIQGEPRTCLMRLAHTLGYSDHSALSQLVNRAFGVRPGMVRGTLGWEWLMERWMRLQRIAPSPRPGEAAGFVTRDAALQRSAPRTAHRSTVPSPVHGHAARPTG
jgi:AraC-like DNA-binding protein